MMFQVNQLFWKNKRVFISGHTGFKGAWLSLWLHELGADITGYALAPPTAPSLFELCKIDKLIRSITSDIRDRDTLCKALTISQPEIVIHMAAQTIVRESYSNPHETYETNVMGTVNLFEAARTCPTVKVILNVTTDKCYENKEWLWGYREIDPLGGYDPYSNSKACSEMITASYRNSFFNPRDYDKHHVAVATARGGNVIGGGDWAKDRIIPDCIRALLNGRTILVRNPKAIRPWQYVLEPLRGYLMLAQALYEHGPAFGESWNFGPSDLDAKPVEWLVRHLCHGWADGCRYTLAEGEQPHEAHYLKLDCSKARSLLGWYSVIDLEQALNRIIEWTRVYNHGQDLRETTVSQIREYMAILPEANCEMPS